MNNHGFIDRLNDAGDHVLFTFYFFLGIGLLVILRGMLDVNPLWVALCMASVLISYSLVIFATKRYRLREDVAADNLYFLGFLYTVQSLITSLYIFSNSSDGSALAVVGDLGVGLVTTLLGLFLRVYFQQLRVAPEEIEEKVRVDITIVAERSRDQLKETSRILEQNKVLMNQILEESRQSLKSVSAKLIKSVVAMDQKVQDVEIPPDAITSRLVPVLNDLNSTISAFSKKVDEMTVPHNLIVDNVNDLFHVANEKIILGVQDNFSNISSVTQSAVEHQVTKIGDQTAKRLDLLKIPEDLITSKINPVVEGLAEGVTATIDSLSAGLINTAAKLDTALDRFDKLEAKILDSNLATSQSIGILNKEVTELLNNVKREIPTILDDAKSASAKSGEAYFQGVEIAIKGLTKNLAKVISPLEVSINTAVKDLEKVKNEAKNRR
jgi:hypothetical protein